MKHSLAALLLIPFFAMAMDQSPVSISKQSFHAQTLKTWDQLYYLSLLMQHQTTR